IVPNPKAGGGRDACRRAGLCGRRRPAPRRACARGRTRSDGWRPVRGAGRRERARVRAGAAVGRAGGARSTCLGGRGHGLLRGPPRPLPAGAGRGGARGRAHEAGAALDALRAARGVLGESELASPRAAGEREALRALMVARAGALAAKKAGLCQLRALIVTCPEPLRSELRSLTRARLLRRLQAVRPERHRDAALRGTLIALRALARPVQALTAEERELKREIEALVAQLARALLDEPGIGPVAAAQVLLSWSHRGRFRSEAAFARLAGAAPIPASSGR